MTEVEIPSLPWPPLPELKRLDVLLRCGICYEFLNTSMVTACSHNYCSLCIRQYLTYKTQCPACFSETTGQQLRNNRLLDEIIGLFPGLRDKVARSFQTSKGSTISGYFNSASNECDDESKDIESSSNGNLAIKSPQASSDFRLITSNVKNHSQRVENTLPQPPLKSPKNSFFSPRSSKGPYSFLSSKSFSASQSPSSSQRSGTNLQVPMRSSQSGSFSSPIRSSQSGSFSTPKQSMPLNQSVAGQFSIQRSPNVKGKSTEATSTCPVCGVSVPERNINLHLDACLQRTEKENTQQVKKTMGPRRQNMAKLVYSLLSDKQLRQKLKEVGLNNQGDRQKLIRRHQKYTVLYNAECDLENPRPLSELLRQVDREEKDLKSFMQQKSVFGYDRKSAPEVIEKEQTEYVKNNSNQFSKLIADVKKRQQEAKKRREEKKVIDITNEASTPSLLNKKDLNLDSNISKSEIKDNILSIRSSIISSPTPTNDQNEIEDDSDREVQTLSDEELANLDLTQPMEDLSDLEELEQNTKNTKSTEVSIKTTPDMFPESSPLENGIPGSHMLSDSDDSNDSFSLLQEYETQEQELEQIPSPDEDSESEEIDEKVRRSSRRSNKQPVQSVAQDKLLLEALGPETQMLSDDEDGLFQDLDYNPTQELDDDDFCGFTKSRRSSRNKRQKPDEDTIMPPPVKKVLRKKRK